MNFQQPSASAIAVNRIFDTNGTQIFGRLNANGQVWLINPNGILFGQGSQVNVGGLVASTLELNDVGSNAKTRTFSGSGSGSIVNRGTINAANGGYVALLGNQVNNHGTISAHLGAVALGAGSAAALTFSGNRLVRMQVDQSVINSVVDNGGLIRADGGLVVMSAGARDTLLSSVVNNTGVVEARTVENRDGTIILLGGMVAGSVNAGGLLDASAPKGGNGGFIETSAAIVKVSGDARVTTAAPEGIAGTWLIDPVDFTIAATGGDMTGATLSANLGGGNVVIQSTSGATGIAGDLNVNDVVAWSANKLTLHAQNNININAALNGSSSASLAFEYGQGAIAAGNTSNAVVRAAVNLPAGPNFSSKLGSDGVVRNYTVITSLGLAGSITGADLQGMNGSLATNYALGGNVDATPTSAWNGGAGFLPIGSLTTAFTGIFDGLGHSVSALSINRSTPDVGLFGYTGIGAAVSNVGLVGGSVVGGAGTGGLVGNNGAANPVSNSYTTGSVTGAAGTGGLVGTNTTGAISSSYATGNVIGAAGTGGLVGSNTSGAISTSYATGNVNGAAGTGGLVGTNTSGPISNSYATGDVVSSGAGTGGLIGSSTSGLITNTYSTGSVSSPGAGIGGLVGSGTSGSVSNSYWDTVSSGQAISPGGGEGRNSTQMMQQGNFNSWDFANTWIIYEGITSPLLRSLMAQLTVTANNDNRSYSGVAYSGGNGVTYSRPLNGTAPAGTLSYGGNAQGIADTGNYVIAPSGLQSDQNYLITFVDGTLTISKAHLTVTADDKSRLYGQANPAFTTSLSGFVNGETAGTAAGLTGSGTANTTATATTNVGTAVITAGAGTLAATNYDFTSTVDGTLTIGKADLTMTANAASKIYDATTAANVTMGPISGLVGSETLGVTATGNFDDKNVGVGKNVSVVYTLANGGNGGLASNYSLADVSVMADIGAANLAVTGVTASNKMFDGTTAATLAGTASVSALGTDAITVAGIGIGMFASAAIGIGKAVSVSGFSLSGADASNYLVVQPGGLIADITAQIMLPVIPLADITGTLQSLFSTRAQLESEALRFPALPSHGGGSRLGGDISLSVSCIVTEIKSAICVGARLSPLLKVVDGGMRLPEDELKGGD